MNKVEAEKFLRLYVTASGKIPFSEWLSNLRDSMTRARIRQRLDRLELGHYGDCKSLGDGVHELRLAFGSGYRIYFAEVDNVIILLLCGGDKHSQAQDIKKAKLFWRDARERSK